MSKSVLITGCSSGFGRLLVQEFLAKGYRVYATLRRLEERRASWSAEEKKYGSALRLLEMDVCKREECEAALALVARENEDGLDVLVNNAGYGLFGAATDLSLEDYKEQFETNVFGLIQVSQLAFPLLQKRQGKLINISSVLGLMGLPLASAYCASKHAVDGFSESLRLEWEPFGVSVCVVNPGSHRTEFSQKSASKSKPGSLFAKRLANYDKQMLLRSSSARPTSPMPVIETVLSLAAAQKPLFRSVVGKDGFAVSLLRWFLPQSVYLRLVGLALKRFYYHDAK